jgi:hypothetical protein
MRDETRVPDWKLERYLVGELPAPEMESVREAADSDSTVRQRLEQLQLSNQDILRHYPAEWMTRQIVARGQLAASAPRTSATLFGRFGSLPKLAAVAVALTVVLLVFLPRQLDRTFKDGTTVETRFKGSVPSLVLYRKLPSGAERLSEGSLARPGDTVQIAYWGVGGHYGVILSLDGRGVVTLHLPARGSEAVPLEAGHLIRLDSAYQLDDAPRWECFYFVTSDKPFQIDPILQSARNVGQIQIAPDRLPLPDSFIQSVFLLRKATRP